MKLRSLVEGKLLVVRGSDDIEIERIVIDSRLATSGSLFVAIKGIVQDGHDHVSEAVARGAAALVVEHETRVPAGFAGAVVVASQGRDALNHLVSRFFGDPGNEMFCVGITGTDGKTSVAWMTEAVLAGCGLPTAVIGTVDHHFGSHCWPGDTTPPPLVLQERLAQFRALGARAVAMEATSQGLSQSRVGSVPFDVAIFTTLTRDHLDYHRSMEAYFEAKARLFTEALCASTKPRRHAIINIDTEYGARICVPQGVTTLTYGRWGCGADLEYKVVSTGLAESRFLLRAWTDEAELHLPMMGDFNGANALAAVAVGLAAGYEFHACVRSLHGFAGVPGRVQRIEHCGELEVLVDYAHDPDAFDRVLSAARDAMRWERSKSQLLTVFGCGGDRDRGKRPLMLRAALRHSDRVIITSDNPRTEDAMGIIKEILAGLPSASDASKIVVEPERAQAIRTALQAAGERDVVMILGKGHEPYQLIGGQRFSFSDCGVVEDELRGLQVKEPSVGLRTRE